MLVSLILPELVCSLRTGKTLQNVNIRSFAIVLGGRLLFGVRWVDNGGFPGLLIGD